MVITWLPVWWTFNRFDSHLTGFNIGSRKKGLPLKCKQNSNMCHGEKVCSVKFKSTLSFSSPM